MIAPALTQVGVPAAAAHMFIFYYAVLFRGEPADGAVAVRRGRAHRRQRVPHDDADVEVHAPAFVVPFLFTLDAAGMGILLRAPARTSRAPRCSRSPASRRSPRRWGWIRHAASVPERVGAGAAGVCCSRRPGRARGGAALAALVLVAHGMRARRAAAR
jgi:hypothetical protein